MASATIAGFPSGTTVSVFLASNMKTGQAPSGSAVTSAVAGASSVTFSGLSESVEYAAYASVGGSHRYVTFSAGPDSPRSSGVEARVDALEERTTSVESESAEATAASFTSGLLPSNEELPEIVVPLTNQSIGSTTFHGQSIPILRSCRLVSAALVTESTIAPLDTSYWSVLLRNLGVNLYDTFYRDLVLADSPVMYYPLDEASGTNAEDLGSGNHDGTYSRGGGAQLIGASGTPGLGPPGIDAQLGALFDGALDWVTLPSFDTALANTLSMEAWVRPEVATGSGTRQTILGANNTAGKPALELGGAGAGGHATNGMAVTIPGIFSASAKSGFCGVNVQKWNHIVYTRSGAGNTHQFYWNGAPIATVGTTDDFTAGATVRDIARRAAASQLLQGRLAHVAMYPTALTQAKIERRYRVAARKTTRATDGERMMPNRQWAFDASSFDDDLTVFKPGDVLRLECIPYDSPIAIVNGALALRFEPV